MQQSADKGQTAPVQTFICTRGRMARKCGTRRRSKTSAVVKKALRSIQPCTRDCSSDVLYGDTGLLPPGVLIDAAKLLAAQTEHGGWPMAQERLRFSFEGSRGVGRAKVHGLVR
jgi:hypothetical protein